MSCDSPNENLEKWDANISMPVPGMDKCTFNCQIKQLCLRGCQLKNTDYCFGIVIYTGPETKIMMNAKKPPTKISNV